MQLEGAFPDTMTKCAELLNRTIDVDFVDINVGCPIDLVYKKVMAALPWSLGWVWPKPGTLPCWPCVSVSPSQCSEATSRVTSQSVRPG